MRQYIALIHKDTGSDYGVSFPDFPGVITAGHDLDEARELAEEALAFHVEGLVEDGETLPQPSSLETIMADEVNRDGVAVLVALKDAPARTVRVNVTFPEEVLGRIDRYAAQLGLSRSAFLSRAAVAAMQDKTTAA